MRDRTGETARYGRTYVPMGRKLRDVLDREAEAAGVKTGALVRAIVVAHLEANGGSIGEALRRRLAIVADGVDRG